MLDRQAETQYYSRRTLDLDAVESVLCIAPHPDDEVLGCGGLLAELACRGKARIQIVVMSRGERAEGQASAQMGHVRVEESCRAANILGVPKPRFLEWEDRGMRYSEPLIQAVQAVLDEQRPQYLLMPSLSEPHPDHQAVALAATEAARRSALDMTLLYYEVGAPLHPNVLLDISAVAQIKWRAIQEFASQNVIQPYEQVARAFARMRGFALGPACDAAEAYHCIDVGALRQRGLASVLPYWPLVRGQLHLANIPQQLPLVSVLVRSMDRPMLPQALAAVAAQTYSHLEVVVVNASGREHAPLPESPQWMVCRMVEPSTQDALLCDRSRAANLALQVAKGDLALFLDDDDLIDPDHVQRLVDTLHAAPRAVAAYAGVRVEDESGKVVRVYDLPWSSHRLRGINFLPIHAVLFDLQKVRATKLEFDASLPVLEDWDFWLRLARLGEFVHCPGVSAVYRQGHGDSGISDPAHPNHWQRWHQFILDRDLGQAASPTNISQLVSWHAIQLDACVMQNEKFQLDLSQLRQELAQRELDLSQLRQELAQRELDLSQLRQELAQRELDLSQLRQELAQEKELRAHEVNALHAQNQYKEAELELIRNSRSWRLTRPLRWFAQKLRQS